MTKQKSLKKKIKKIKNHALDAKCKGAAVATDQTFYSSLSLQYKILIFNQGCS